jgi:hypothetical protein
MSAASPVAAEPMPCPDEDTYARLLEGRLGDDERHEVELHLDQCGSCSLLLAEIAKVYGASLTGDGLSSTLHERTRLPARAPGTEVLTGLSHLQLVAAVLQSVIALKLVWLLASTRGDLGAALDGGAWSDVAAGIGRVAFSYGLAWAPLGALLALVSTWALRRGVRWAAGLTAVYAVLSLPSLIFLPLSGYVLLELRRIQARSRP